jgi:hypothetical protein
MDQHNALVEQRPGVPSPKPTGKEAILVSRAVVKRLPYPTERPFGTSRSWATQVRNDMTGFSSAGFSNSREV